MGFESGADDYVTKPFYLTVLTKRVDALLKRGASPKEKKTENENITLGSLIINPLAHEVYLDGIAVGFTLKEYKILLKLASNPGRVYTREQLLDEVWGYEYEGDTRTVDSHVARLRTKLSEWGVNHIKTIYGTGYKIQM
jgi:DNA-binding response OmpR family regulator